MHLHAERHEVRSLSDDTLNRIEIAEGAEGNDDEMPHGEGDGEVAKMVLEI